MACCSRDGKPEVCRAPAQAALEAPVPRLLAAFHRAAGAQLQPLLRKPAATPLMVRWMARLVRSSVCPPRCRRSNSTCR